MRDRADITSCRDGEFYTSSAQLGGTLNSAIDIVTEDQRHRECRIHIRIRLIQFIPELEEGITKLIILFKYRHQAEQERTS